MNRAVLLAGCLLVSGCGGTRDMDRIREDAGQKLEQAQEEARDAVEAARKRISEWAGMSEAEVRKLWTIEYRTIRVSKPDLEAVDETLNQLGEQRWECYHVTEDARGRTFFFKRASESSLRYIPLRDLLRLFSFLNFGE